MTNVYTICYQKFVKLYVLTNVDSNDLMYLSETMKRILIIYIILCSLVGFCQNQKLTATFLHTKTFLADTLIGLDGMENYYSIKNNVFIKQNETQTWEYKNITLGKITKVDIINPLKIVLFYEYFNTVITLDNQLNEIQKINFSDINNAIVVSKIGMAAQNQFWIYNTLNQQIGLFDSSSNVYKFLGQPIQEIIKYTQSDFNYFQWIDAKNRWYTCDIFGKIAFIGTVPDFKQIQIIDNDRLILYDGEKLYYQNNKTQTLLEIAIVEKSFEKFYYKDQILAIFTNQEITNYKITIP